MLLNKEREEWEYFMDKNLFNFHCSQFCMPDGSKYYRIPQVALAMEKYSYSSMCLLALIFQLQIHFMIQVMIRISVQK